MRHFPIFLKVDESRIVVAGGGEAAVSKLRLLLKTDARITVFAQSPQTEIRAWAASGRLRLVERKARRGDAAGALLFYAASGDDAEDARAARIARAHGARVNIVDDLEGSDFITPAIVDRHPVTVAIGTEGAAPVLARRIKAQLEESLDPGLGALARAARRFRPRAATLSPGRARRAFWSDYFDRAGPRAVAAAGETGLAAALAALLRAHLSEEARPGRVDFVGAGPGDPELLTLKARKALDAADVVIHDRLVSREILDLARREARLVDAGKEGFGPSVPQDRINALLVDISRTGAQVVRLKSGDPTIFGRLDEELEAVQAAGIPYSIVPGITAASASVAQIGQSLTRRGRNSSVRFLTAHDLAGFADHDWASLARPGEVAAIYMAKRAGRYLQGRLLMHGADPATPVTVVENASRPEQQVLETRLSRLEPDLGNAGLAGPALIILGLAPRRTAAAPGMPHLEAPRFQEAAR